MGLRSINFLEPGSSKRVFFERLGPSATFIVSDEDRGAAAPPTPVAWRLRFYVQGGHEGEQSGYAYVGSVRTLPWGNGSRVIAVCSIPGARDWAVDGRPEDHSATGRLNVDALGSPVLGSLGVNPLPGASLAGAHCLRIATGVAGAVNVPGSVLGWSATADALLGATVSINMPGFAAPQVIQLQPGQTLSDTYGDASGDAVQFVFTNTVSYLVDYELTGDGVDNV